MTRYLKHARLLAGALALVVGLTLVAPPAFAAGPAPDPRPIAAAATAKVEAMPAATPRRQAAPAAPAAGGRRRPRPATSPSSRRRRASSPSPCWPAASATWRYSFSNDRVKLAAASEERTTMRKILILSLLLLVAALPVAAQSLVGTVAGTVKDEQGGVLPGVTVTLTGKTGSRTAVTDAEGAYRFAGVDPGTYSVTAELSGFRPKRQDNVDVAIGKVADDQRRPRRGRRHRDGRRGRRVAGRGRGLELDRQHALPGPALQPADPARQRRDRPPQLPARRQQRLGLRRPTRTTATRSSSTASTPATPTAGSAWTFFNFNLVEEVQVGGLGAPAEYGAYTGAVVNTLTKSGGNRYAGLFDVYWTKNELLRRQHQARVRRRRTRRSPTRPSPTRSSTSPPSSAGRSSRTSCSSSSPPSASRSPTTRAAPIERRDRGEPPLQRASSPGSPAPTTTCRCNFQWDYYNVTGRCDCADAALQPGQLTVNQDSPEAIWGAAVAAPLRHRRPSPRSSTPGWWGYYYLDPQVPRPHLLRRHDQRLLGRRRATTTPTTGPATR